MSMMEDVEMMDMSDVSPPSNKRTAEGGDSPVAKRFRHATLGPAPTSFNLPDSPTTSPSSLSTLYVDVSQPRPPSTPPRKTIPRDPTFSSPLPPPRRSKTWDSQGVKVTKMRVENAGFGFDAGGYEPQDVARWQESGWNHCDPKWLAQKRAVVRADKVERRDPEVYHIISKRTTESGRTDEWEVWGVEAGDYVAKARWYGTAELTKTVGGQRAMEAFERRRLAREERERKAEERRRRTEGLQGMDVD